MDREKGLPLPGIESQPSDPTRLACCASLVAQPINYRVAKRTLDFVGAAILLIFFFPLFFLLTLMVRVSSPGPIFYRSNRVGVCGTLFPFVKFRTMYVDADRRLGELQHRNEKDGPIFKIKDDPRITPVGKFMRKFSLDELPQLISVLNGDMSLVGPRPPIPHEVEQYDEETKRRLTVKPGMTCYWQISGRSNLTFEEWMAMDRKYIDEMSFFVDIAILLKTPLAVIKGDGAY